MHMCIVTARPVYFLIERTLALSSEILSYIMGNKQSITTFQTGTYFLQLSLENTHLKKTQMEICVKFSLYYFITPYSNYPGRFYYHPLWFCYGSIVTTHRCIYGIILFPKTGIYYYKNQNSMVCSLAILLEWPKYHHMC